MPKANKPFPAPSHLVRPMQESEYGLANASAGEKLLFDSLAQEKVNFGGTPMEFYSLDRRLTKVDYLYGESTDKHWRGPYHFKAQFVWPDPTPEQREEGYRNTLSTQCWVSRKSFDDLKVPAPDRGDIIRVWNIPFINNQGVDSEGTPNAGYYFNVVNVADDAHMFDNPDFSMFRFDIRRYSESVPERRIFPP